MNSYIHLTLKYQYLLIPIPLDRVVAECRALSCTSQGRRRAYATLTALGADTMIIDILAGHIDLHTEPDGELYAIDHRVVKQVITRLTEGGKEDEGSS